VQLRALLPAERAEGAGFGLVEQLLDAFQLAAPVLGDGQELAPPVAGVALA
jgi:hypothetical protein